MKSAVIFLTDGCEEAEAVFPADILRRAGVDVKLLSITGKLEITGSRGIKLVADGHIESGISADMLILPGGWGAQAYIDNSILTEMLKRQNSEGKYIAAICAAPVTLGKLGILDDKAATCYPAKQEELVAKECKQDAVVIDGNIITARAPGASAQFGLTLAGILVGEEEAERVKGEMYF